jgi:Tfp pilus assembly pilus retraction ATPase PilT
MLHVIRYAKYMDLNQLLQLTIDKKASDLHIIANYCPTIRVDG